MDERIPQLTEKLDDTNKILGRELKSGHEERMKLHAMLQKIEIQHARLLHQIVHRIYSWMDEAPMIRRTLQSVSRLLRRFLR
jgi:hypothetical protein